jgi:hypothetical protein
MDEALDVSSNGFWVREITLEDWRCRGEGGGEGQASEGEFQQHGVEELVW